MAPSSSRAHRCVAPSRLYDDTRRLRPRGLARDSRGIYYCGHSRLVALLSLCSALSFATRRHDCASGHRRMQTQLRHSRYVALSSSRAHRCDAPTRLHVDARLLWLRAWARDARGSSGVARALWRRRRRALTVVLRRHDCTLIRAGSGAHSSYAPTTLYADARQLRPRASARDACRSTSLAPSGLFVMRSPSWRGDTSVRHRAVA